MYDYLKAGLVLSRNINLPRVTAASSFPGVAAKESLLKGMWWCKSCHLYGRRQTTYQIVS